MNMFGAKKDKKLILILTSNYITSSGVYDGNWHKMSEWNLNFNRDMDICCNVYSYILVYGLDFMLNSYFKVESFNRVTNFIVV